MNINKRIVLFVSCLIMGCMLFTGCAGNKKGKDDPITLTIWHVYGGQTDSPLNTLIEEFNHTVGKEKGINIQVAVVSNTNNIHDAVLKSANNEPGASKLPDLFISYPKTVMAMPDDSVLADFNDYFTEEELAAYIPEFVEEGIIKDRLLVFPVAKSTEIMFINKTLFDRFQAATGVTMEDLSTWEGLFETAKIYRQWTDEQTPDIENDGKNFFVHDYHFNYFQVGTASLGEDFFDGESIADTKALEQAWIPYADAAIEGGIWLHEGYATEPLRTGDIVVSVASSASVLYYEDIVTYADNTSEPIEVISRPVPVFSDGSNLVMQRGAGICLTKSTKEREEAAVTFIKWLTEPQNNVRFVTQVGYMPVTEKAFEYLPDAISELESAKYKSLYEAFIDTQKSYHFYSAPKLETYLELEMNLEKEARAVLLQAHEKLKQDPLAKEELLKKAYQDIFIQ